MINAIPPEKANGALYLLLTTDLRSWEIIVGKWFARCLQITWVSLPALPLLLLFARLPLTTTLATLMLSLTAAFTIAACGLVASVENRTTWSAALGVYCMIGLAVVILRCLEWGNYADPCYLLAPAWGDNDLAALRLRLGLWLAGCLVVVTTMLAIASWRLRPSARRALTANARPSLVHWLHARPSVDDDPVRWKERHLERFSFLWLLAIVPQPIRLALIAAAAVLLSLWILYKHCPPEFTAESVWQLLSTGQFSELLALWLPNHSLTFAFAAQSALALLLLGVTVALRGVETIRRERRRKTWEALLLTACTPEELVCGKLWGILDTTFPFYLAFAIPTLLLSATARTSALFINLAVLSVSWPILHFCAAFGLACSCRMWSDRRQSPLSFLVLSCITLPFVLGCTLGLLVPAILFLEGTAPRASFAYWLSFGILGFMGLFWVWILHEVAHHSAKTYLREAIQLIAAKATRAGVPKRQ